MHKIPEEILLSKSADTGKERILEITQASAYCVRARGAHCIACIRASATCALKFFISSCLLDYDQCNAKFSHICKIILCICAVPREEWDVTEEDERDWPSEDLLYFTFFSACNFSYFFYHPQKIYNAPSSER